MAPPDDPSIAGWQRGLIGVYGVIATVVALWFGLLGWVVGGLGGGVAAVWYVGSGLLAAASAFTAIAAAASGDRIWRHRAAWAAAALVVWMVGAGLAVAALD